ncbi:mycothiol synthase [Gordonia sp. HY002]|uniref:mycothiol synthase n=1 Tax=Gordonia zhenghanii TaxID=2911516 RepID=UPI001EF02002|nr:mycothiol synthase [Gordonia zhenghanii]MCF8568908.1 mycothiol synthase [Gordonia zhenghanii]MCF8603003.1 mycothiol synthase [Gordonia zhenghanii]
MSNSFPSRIVRGALTAADVDYALTVLDEAERVDGVEPLSEQHRLAVRNGGALHIVTEHGYGNVLDARDGEAPMAEAVVHPEHRGAGEGRVLVDAVLDAAAELGDRPQVWAHGDLPAAGRVADVLGLERHRELLQLRRPLSEPLLELAQRDDLVVRTYRPGDDDEILRVNNAAFDWHPEQGGWTQGDVDERTGAAWFDPAGVFLAFDAADPDTLLGFHWTKVDKPDLGEVYIVGVDPSAQGRGLGNLLTLAGLHYLAERDLSGVELYVEGDNTAALHTYARLGFTRYRADITYRKA